MARKSRVNITELKALAKGRWLDIFATLAGVRLESDIERRHGPCPRCGGTDRFRAIDLDNGALYCNQCFSKQNSDGIAALGWLTGKPFKESVDLLCNHLGETPRHKKNGKSHVHRTFITPQGIVRHYLDSLAKKTGGQVKLAATWQYETFTVLRFDLPTPAGEKQRKEFRPVHQVPLGTDGGMGWQGGYPSGPRPIYRKKEVESARPDLVTIHGGEKAADAATKIGLVAAANAGGEKSTNHTDWSPVLRFGVIAIVIDNDSSGEAFGRLMTAKVRQAKPDADVRIVRLPDLPPKGDIVEWIEAGGTKAKFLELLAETPSVTDEQVAEWETKTRPSRGNPHEDAEPKLNVPIVADMICSVEHFAKDAGGKLYRYSDGAYRARGDVFIKRQVKAICTELEPGKWSTRFAAEVVEFIRLDATELWERPSMEVLNVKNGLLRIKDRKLLPHSPKHLSTVQLHFDYDPSAVCTAIEKFISEVFPTDAVGLAWELAGWLMVPDVSIQKAVLLTGEGANGKSTYLTMLVAFIGKANVSGVALHSLEKDKFKVARLLGKLANICPDLPSEHLAGTSTFKAIVGGDTLDAEYKFRDSFDFVPFCRLVFSANHPPRSQDASHAFFRRWVVIPFDRTMEPGEQIPRDVLDARLAAPGELSGLLNKALDGRERLKRQRGFSESQSVKEAWNDFYSTTDPMAVWLEKFTIDDPGAYVAKKDLRVAYNGECERRGRPSMGNKQFGQALRRVRPGLRDAQRVVNGKTTWCYVGIGLIHPEDDDSRDSRDYPSLFLSQGNGTDEVLEEETISHGEQNRENRVNRVNRVNDCQHGDVEEKPTSDGRYINRTCRICGVNLRCRKAETTP